MMTFASPLWLLGLLPWIALAAWLLSGRRRRATVPFLNLWRGPVALPRPQREIQRPPLPIVLLLAVIFLAILAAGRPWLNFIHRSSGPPITIIIDRGITMSARGNSQPRWKELIESSRDEIAKQLGAGPVNLILVPDGSSTQTDRDNWANIALQQSSTDQDTRQLLPQIVRSALHDSPLIVLSDQRMDDEKVIQISPPTQPKNVGIAAVAGRDLPSLQVMVRLRNDSDLQKAGIKIESVVHAIDLPSRGEERNYFFDAKQIAGVNVDLLVDDDLPADNRATLTKRRSWPAIRAEGDLPDEVQRMIQTYAKLRPPEAASVQVVVGTSDQASVIVATNADEKISGELRVVNHPIAANVDWSKTMENARSAKPQAAWQPVVSAGDEMLVGVRDTPARQVWIGFDSPTFSRSSDFVIFWTNVFDWVGQGGDVFAADGARAVPIPPVIQTAWENKLRALPATDRGGFDASKPLLVGAVLLVLAAAVVLSTCKNCAAG